VAQLVKPFTTLGEQVELLKKRGMGVGSENLDHWLQSVGYYRLSGYWYPYRAIKSNGHRADEFVAGTNFDDVAKLYEFDRKLRTLVHDGIERVEVAIRSSVSNTIGEIDPFAYQNKSIFRPGFAHANWISTVNTRIGRAHKNSTMVQHHFIKYGGNLPIWALVEILDFADTSKLFSGLTSKHQWTIAENLGISIIDTRLSPNQRSKARKHHPLARWMEQITVVRNTAAHHSRLWNSTFVPAPTAAMKTVTGLESLPEGQSERLYGALLVIAKITSKASPGTPWANRVDQLVDTTFSEIKLRDPQEMGYPMRHPPGLFKLG